MIAPRPTPPLDEPVVDQHWNAGAGGGLSGAWADRRALAIAAVLLLTACSDRKSADAPAHSDANAARAETPVPVRVVRVAANVRSEPIAMVGTVRYQVETPLAFTTPGKVATVRYREGDMVGKGALLASLDTTSVNGDLSVSRAELIRATAEDRRIAQLQAQGWVTSRQREASAAALALASARIDQARFAVNTARLVAPSAGRILARPVEPGQVVAAGTPVLVLGEASGGIVLEASIADRDVARLRPGMPAEVSISAFDEAPVAGVVARVQGRAVAGTGAFLATVRLPPDRRLLSGQIGTATVRMPARADGLLEVPASALVSVRGGEAVVFVVAGGRALARNIVIETIDKDRVLVSGSLRPGDTVVSSGAQRLRAGSLVKVVGFDRDAPIDR